MSVPVSPETRTPLAWNLQLITRSAVGAARVLILLPPSRLCRVLRLLSRGARPASHAQALAARQAVVAVSVRCAGLGCTQRSVAAVLLCRMRGQWPDWCTGFRMQPFAAHAWVEVDGTPVGEPSGIASFETVLSVRHRAGWLQ